MFNRLRERLKSRFVRLGPTVETRATILYLMVLLVLPLLVIYIITNILQNAPVFIIQNLVLLLSCGLTLYLLRKARYNMAVNSFFLIMSGISLASFIAGDIRAGVPTASGFQFATVHAVVTVFLIGIFAMKRYQLIVAYVYTFIFLVVHYHYLSVYKIVSVMDSVGFFTYHLLAMMFSTFIFILFREHANIIKVREDLNRELQEANAVTDKFVGNMSHELRNPLNAINGMTELLKKSKLTGKQGTFVRNIESCNTLMLQMVNNMLDLNRLQRLDYGLQEEEFDLAELCSSVVQLYWGRTSDRNLAVKMHNELSSGSIVQTDMQALTQILMNLMDNACKFTENGSVDLYLSEASEDDYNFRIRLEDTGIGMEKPVQEKIYERFFQADSGYTKKYRGTGIGLNVVWELVRRLKGKIEVNSSPGKGTGFILSFHFKKCGEQQKAVEEAEVSIRGISILLAEDEAVNRMFLENCLKTAGAEVRAVKNGKVFLEEYKKKRPDLVILDLQMPVISGFECLEKLRQNSGNEKKSTPVIVTTGYSNQYEIETVNKYKVSAILNKPVLEITLIKAVQEAVSR